MSCLCMLFALTPMAQANIKVKHGNSLTWIYNYSKAPITFADKKIGRVYASDYQYPSPNALINYKIELGTTIKPGQVAPIGVRTSNNDIINPPSNTVMIHKGKRTTLPKATDYVVTDDGISELLW